MNEQPSLPLKTHADILREFRAMGVTPTAQRLKIAAAIFSRPQHFSADDLLGQANSEGRKVSKATVYNTLDLFVRKGLVRQLIVDPTRVFYDSTTHAHYHFFDQETQQLIDVNQDEVAVTLPTSLPEGMEIADVDVIIHLRRSNGTH